jgi:hypothetical protein
MMAGLMMAELRGAAPKKSGAEFGPATGFRPAAQLYQT